MRGLYIKEGPTVFLKRVFVMELVAGLIFLGLSYLGNYEMLYRSMGIDSVLRYDLFTMIAFSIFQLIYLLALFLNWYFSYFELRDNEIVKKSGIIFHKKQIFSLVGVTSVGTLHSPIDRVIGHATIVLEDRNGPILKMRNVPNYYDYVDIIKRSLNLNHHNNSIGGIIDLIEQGENSKVEFKETLRFDTKTKSVSKDLEKAVLKSIVGFLNAEGGTLLIGVKDDSTISGLKDDYETLVKKNKDGFENHLFSLIRSMIGVNFGKLMSIHFEQFEAKEFCVLQIKGSSKPAFLKQGEREDFFVRTGNSTRSLSMSEAEEYIRNRFA